MVFGMFFFLSLFDTFVLFVFLQIHGVLNAVSWGLLFPIGVVMARYLRVFPSADPAWFYLHISCQISAYAIGVAGWGTGMKLGSESEGFVAYDHRNIGIALFSMATLQVFLQPNYFLLSLRNYWSCFDIFSEFCKFPWKIVLSVKLL